MNKQRDESTAPSDPGHTNRDPSDVAPLPPVESRRRLFRGVAGGAGVLLAVSSKTALGTGLCQSPSAKMSGNTSNHRHTSQTCKGGLSPGFWKVPQHFGHWARAGANYPRFAGGVECTQSWGQIKNLTPTNAGTLVTAIFGGGPSIGLWQHLKDHDNPGEGNFLVHLIAAWLNAGYFGTDYPLTQAEVVRMWDTRLVGFCPASSPGCLPKWAPADIVGYISGMYDLNTSLGTLRAC